MSVVTVREGESPIILAFPHSGTDVPPDIFARLNGEGQVLRDTDWHLHRLYDGLLPGATIVSAKFHRYVIDANRDPQGVSLYPGQNTTGLVPLTNFDGEAIWLAGQEPTEADISDRLERFFQPYHAALAQQIERVKALHGVAILYDCHSIRSQIAFLFEGTLPDFNLGTNIGQTCAPELEHAASRIIANAPGFSYVVNGRFKGGWTTRHYGQPQNAVHAVQMELAQSTHLATETPPFAYDETRAEKLRPHLSALFKELELLAPKLTRGQNEH